MMIRCIHQLMPPKFRAPKWMGFNSGWGDCHTCTPDIANKHCPGFTPAALRFKVIRIRDDEIVKINGAIK